MKKKLFLIAALAVAAAVAAWYVLRMDQGDGMAYLTEPVTIGNITRTVNATGEVGAVQLVSVGAQVGGQIKKLHVVLGQDVKKGDLIAEIDSVPQLNQLETDKAASRFLSCISRSYLVLAIFRATFLAASCDS